VAAKAAGGGNRSNKQAAKISVSGVMTSSTSWQAEMWRQKKW